MKNYPRMQYFPAQEMHADILIVAFPARKKNLLLMIRAVLPCHFSSRERKALTALER